MASQGGEPLAVPCADDFEADQVLRYLKTRGGSDILGVRSARITTKPPKQKNVNVVPWLAAKVRDLEWTQKVSKAGKVQYVDPQKPAKAA